MAGVPPFNGFYSKEFLFEATYEAAAAGGGLAWLLPATAVLASVFTVLYSLRFLSVFFGGRPADLGRIERPHVTLVVFPGVLAVLAGVIGIAPGLAVEAIVGRAVDATVLAPVEVHAGLPDHVTPPVVMSAVAILTGVGAYPFVGRIEDAVETATRTATPVRPNWWYDRLLDGTEATGERLGPVVHNGQLRTYATWVVAVAAGFALLGYLATGAVLLPGTGAGPWVAVDWPGVPPAMALVLAVAAAAGVAVTAASSHVAGVLTLSILGFMIAIFYILASAPDLALTQLLVETLVLLVFLLVLEELPEFYADLEVGRTVRDAALSVAVGGVAFLTVLLAAPQPAAEQTRIARYYVEQAVPAAGGTNVVNVILVDFRGFDTLGELLAVSFAAISVLVLITMRNRGETG
jgi:multicomponent Na+:H+ antiporter subunit A